MFVTFLISCFLNQTFGFCTQEKHGGVLVLRIVFVKKALLDTSIYLHFSCVLETVFKKKEASMD